jgi:hypothetical protein
LSGNRAEPRRSLLNGFVVFLVLLDRVGVVVAQVKSPPYFFALL